MSEQPARLKLPAYGKALLDNRRRGFHPLVVDVWYGDDWSIPRRIAEAEQNLFVVRGREARPYSADWEKEVGNPTLAIRPRDYAPGVFDFRCVAGVGVYLWDCCGGSADFDQVAGGPITRWGLFYFLAGELSAYAATVFFRNTGDAETETAAHLAVTHSDVVAGKLVYPAWWSSALSLRHREARPLWQQDVKRALQRSGATESECVESR